MAHVSIAAVQIMNFDPADENYMERDRFILSKGHACVSVYATLAEVGLIPKEDLKTYGDDFSWLMNHINHKVTGVEFSSGSLGHGLSFGVGKAWAAKSRNSLWRTYVLLSDGEMGEGSNWEALMFAAHHNLDNLTAIIDRNGLCIHGTTEEINHLDPLDKKFESFGWHVEIVNGHNINEMVSKLKDNNSGKPKMISANTVKGKGVSFMENVASWHHGGISNELYEQAKTELSSS